MKLLILGNIGSGKTTLCKALYKIFPKWEYIAIDDFRRVFSDGTLKSDSIAKSAFVKSISHDTKNQIIECSGLGRLGSSIYRRLQKYDGPLIVVVLNVDVEICIHRLKTRVWDVPFPQDSNECLELIRKMDKQYQSNFLFDRWGLRHKTIFIQTHHDNELDSSELLSSIIELIK